MGALHNLDFSATETLNDGTEVVIRAVRPDDKALISESFSLLSDLTRYRRFLHHKVRLTPEELRLFTEIDGDDHYALGVLGAGVEPMAIARLVREADRTNAEVAIVVVDRHQRRGVGRVLMQHLVDAARERDIARLRFTMLSENNGMRGLIEASVGPYRVIEREGAVMTVEADVPVVASEPSEVWPPLDYLRRTARSGWLSPLGAARGVNRWIERWGRVLEAARDTARRLTGLDAVSDRDSA